MDGLLSMFEEQFKKGEPYRDAFRGLLRGDTAGWNKLNAPSLADPQEAVDIATGFAGTIKPVQRKVFEEAFNLAQQRAALPVSEGGLGLPATNTAMDRAKAMGNDTLAYTGSNIEGEIESMLPKSWFSKEPGYSSTYSTVIPSDGISKDPRVYPVLLRTGKTEVNPMFGLYEDMEKALSKKKTDTFKVENVGGGTNDFYVIKNPNQARSIFAAFDPFRRNEPDLLAGVAAAPAGLLAIDEEKPKKKRSNK